MRIYCDYKLLNRCINSSPLQITHRLFLYIIFWKLKLPNTVSSKLVNQHGMGWLIIKCAALWKCLNKWYELMFPHFLIVSGKYYFSFSSRGGVFRMDCCFIVKWLGGGEGWGLLKLFILALFLNHTSFYMLTISKMKSTVCRIHSGFTYTLLFIEVTSF